MIVVDKCITLRLTETQRRAVRDILGHDVEALTIPVAELEERAIVPDEVSQADDDAVVWECLNPYP
jgi:hypothetical protein